MRQARRLWVRGGFPESFLAANDEASLRWRQQVIATYLVLELPKRQRWAIEIKRSSAPVVSKGFHTGAEELKATKRFVVHAGKDSFPLTSAVNAITLVELQRELTGLAK